jgi:hypothetical protein
MDNKLNYQQARTVRKQSLKDVIADELIRGKGLGSAITGAIGLKTQARMKGFKEKFDPLNIVKFLTFGSRLGPALYGKLFGRSQKDVEYFTGRAKQIGRGNQKQIKDGGGEGDENTGGIKTVLKQMLTFLQKSHEGDMTLREQENNLKESNKLDDEKRHKELLKALGVRTVGEPTATLVEKPKEDNGFLGGLMDSIGNMFKGITDKISSIMGHMISFGEHIKDIFKYLGSFSILKSLIRIVPFILRLASSPVTWLIAGMISLYEFQQWVRKNVTDAMAEAERKAIESGDVKSLRQHIENRRKTDTDNANSTGNPLDAGVFTDPSVMEYENKPEIKKEIKRRFEESRDTTKDRKIRLNAINALSQIEVEDESKKLEYFKENKIDPKTATPQQLKNAQDYADDEINLNGTATYIKPAIPGRPTPQTKEGKETLTVLEQIPANFWKWMTSPTEDTPDDKMYKKMFEVMQKNPLGPWNFDKEIPGYNQWNRTAKPVEQTGKYNGVQQDNLDLMLASMMGQKSLSGTSTPSTPKAVNTSGVKVASNQTIPMPSMRDGNISYRKAIYDSIVISA